MCNRGDFFLVGMYVVLFHPIPSNAVMDGMDSVDDVPRGCDSR